MMSAATKHRLFQLKKDLKSAKVNKLRRCSMLCVGKTIKLISSYISKSSPVREFTAFILKPSNLWCFWALMAVLSVWRIFNWVLLFLLCNAIILGKDTLIHFFPEVFSVLQRVV